MKLSFALSICFLGLVSASRSRCPKESSSNWCRSAKSSTPTPVSPEEPDYSNPKCAREMEGIVYVPANPARDYLEKLITQLLLELIGLGDPFSMQLPMSKIQSFVQKYNVNVFLQPDFSNRQTIQYTPQVDRAQPYPRFIGQIIAPTYLNLKGFGAIVNVTTRQIESFAMSTHTGEATTNGYTLIISTSAKDHLFYDC